MKALGLIVNFYKSFALACWLITLACMSIAYTHGMSTFTVIFWFKVISLGAIVHFINSYKRNEFYYYKNLGLSKLTLWIATLSLDFILFIALIVLTLQIR